MNGAVKLGMGRVEALEMAIGAMRGAAALVASGEDSNELARKMATPGGSTAVGLEALEEAG